MNDATGQILDAAAFAIRMRGVATEAIDALMNPDSTLMGVLELTNEFSEKQEAKAAAKAEKKAAKKAIKKAEKNKQAATKEE
jgi:acetate kinase